MNRQSENIFDELLLMKIKSGDVRAWSLFIKRWNQRLFQRIIYLTQNEEAAKDVLQESWSHIYKSIGKLKQISSYKSWMMTICNRKSYDWIRKQSKNKTDSIEDIDFIDSEANDEDHFQLTSSIRSELRTLDKNHRIILTMFYLDNYTLNQICTLLKLSKGTVKSRLYYAREKLKKRIKEYQND